MANDGYDALPPRERGAILFHKYFPFDAEYSFLVRVRGNPAAGVPSVRLPVCCVPLAPLEWRASSSSLPGILAMTGMAEIAMAVARKKLNSTR